MKVDRYTKFLITILAFALLLIGLNPWLQPPSAGAMEVAATSEISTDTDCTSAKKNSLKNLEAVNTLERLLGYIESSVNNIQLTVNRIDRGMNNSSSSNSSDRR